MTEPSSGLISIRTVILNGAVTMDRKFYALEIGQLGRLMRFLEIIITVQISVLLILAPETTKLF